MTLFRVRLKDLAEQTTYYFKVDSMGADGVRDGVMSPIKSFAIRWLDWCAPLFAPILLAPGAAKWLAVVGLAFAFCKPGPSQSATMTDDRQPVQEKRLLQFVRRPLL
jgi:hypothetical protein